MSCTPPSSLPSNIFLSGDCQLCSIDNLTSKITARCKKQPTDNNYQPPSQCNIKCTGTNYNKTVLNNYYFKHDDSGNIGCEPNPWDVINRPNTDKLNNDINYTNTTVDIYNSNISNNIFTGYMKDINGDYQQSRIQLADCIKENNKYILYTNDNKITCKLTNIAASNLAASNLAASNLPASKLAASNLPASNLAASNVAASNVAAYNLAASNLYASNVDASNVAAYNLAASNLYASNQTASNQTASNVAASKLYASNVAAYNLDASNLYASNQTASKLDASNLAASNLCFKSNCF
jgi:hypothetical protein